MQRPSANFDSYSAEANASLPKAKAPLTPSNRGATNAATNPIAVTSRPKLITRGAISHASLAL